MHWFAPYRVDGDLAAAVESLKEFGIEFELTSHPAYYEVVEENGHSFIMKQIGEVEVLDAGGIRALAYQHLTGRDIRCLLGAAEQAFHVPPKTGEGWFRRRNKNRPRWECSVLINVDEDDDLEAAVIARDADRWEKERRAEKRDAASREGAFA